MNMSKALIVACAVIGLSCSRQGQPDNTLSEQEKSAGWRLLFDGTTAKGWRGFNEASLPDGWLVENGNLKSLGHGGDIGGDIVFADAVFGNFELSLEWKLSKGGNSGIFYHVIEGKQYRAAYENGPEYQVIDDLEFPEPLEAWQRAGADYAMYAPDTGKVVKPAGQWNSSRIVFTPERVEYYLNGKMTVSFVPWSADWQARKESGKWKDYPDYGKAREGYIGLQDHGSVILYKNIKIRNL
jgi:hypothetical protein